MSKRCGGPWEILLSAFLIAIVFSGFSFAANDPNAPQDSSSNGAPVTQPFTLQTNAQTYIVVPGQSAPVNVTVNTNGSGFSGYLTYTCSDTAPESICITPQLPVSSSLPASLSITTTAPTASLRSPFDRRSRTFYAFLLPGLLGIVVIGGRRPRSQRTMRVLGMIVVLGLSTLWLSSCANSSNGSSSSPGTPKGGYTITITATSAAGTTPASGQAQITLQVE
jgi:hypothetical protein